MPVKRSRPQTEARFRQAVLEIVTHAGCAEVGINNVAQHAGADKVLLYRYFGDLDGLWQSVAESRHWMPDPDAVLAGRPTDADAGEVLHALADAVRRFAEDDPVVCRLLAWRKAVSNPLTDRFNEEWTGFWQAAGGILAQSGDTENRLRWNAACQAAALLVEAEICGESTDRRCFEAISNGLQSPPPAGNPLPATETVPPDTLPTNLL